MERACARGWVWGAWARACRVVGAGVTVFSRVNRVCRVTIRYEGGENGKYSSHEGTRFGTRSCLAPPREAIGPQVPDEWFLKRGVVFSHPVVHVYLVEHSLNLVIRSLHH